MKKNKKSVLISVVGLVFAALGGWHTALAAYDNLTLSAMFASPAFLVQLAGSAMPIDAPPLARLAAEHMQILFSFYFFASLAMFISGLGLLFRKAWALKTVQGFFYIGAASCFIVFLFPGLMVPKPYIYEGVSLTPDFNAAVAHMKFQLRFLCIFPGVTALWLARRFEKSEIKSEFKIK